MILVGYAATCDAAIDGYFFAPGAIDCNQEGVKLFHRHEREIGRVLCMQYHGDRLLATVETDDPIALKTDFMSPAAQVLALDGKRVTKARLIEISLTGTPANPHCRVLERRQNDPMRELWKSRLKWHDQVGQWCGLLQKYVELLPQIAAVATTTTESKGVVQPLDAPPIREMTPQDRTRLAAIHERQARRFRSANLPAPTSSFSSMVAELNQRPMEA